MKKIGIVTTYGTNNYGSVLQALALTNVIKNLQYDVYLIDFLDLKKEWNKKIQNNNKRIKVNTLIKNPTILFKKIVSYHNNKYVSKSIVSEERKQIFSNFLYDRFSFPNEDYRNDDNFIAFIAGSDQVWSLNSPFINSTYFLRFCDEYKRVAYAASFGGTKIPNSQKTLLNRFLNEFSALSAREFDGVKIIEKFTKKEVTQVLDPVLLIDKQFWSDVIKHKKSYNEEYILCYILNNNHSFFKALYNFSIATNLKVVFVEPERNIDVWFGQKVLIDPLEMVALIKNARYVCTDSLHGMELSLVFNKPFIIVERNYDFAQSQNIRIKSLVKLLNLQRQYLKKWDQLTPEIFEVRNYDEVNKIILKNQMISLKYLRKSISECESNGKSL